MAVALRLEGLSRHASTHAAGVVISPRPRTDIVPLYKSNRDEITTQYDMNALERIGLLKMDFLGLTTLTVLHDTVRMIQQNRGAKIDIDNLALDDAETYKLFARGETTAIFQFESHGMRDILRRYHPTRIEDLTALNALYRPGPIQGGMIDDFINRKQGKTKVTFELPQLKDILEETYGVILYQEQVMQIANRLASFSLGEADILRRAMGKKKKEEMAAQRAKFMTGCATNKIPEKKAERIFNLMEEFAGYGFNKSHSCAYALLAYQTAYLKTHYPVEFMAALLTSEAGNTEKVVKYINEARGMSISILPPDVNESDLYFTPVGESIRFGLAAIKNVGENTAKAIRESRLSQGEFKSLYDFCERIESRFLNKRVFESLIKSGAVDSLGPRESMLASVDDAVAALQRASRTRESGQHGLFGTAAAPALSPFELREAAPWSEEERLASEYAMLGFYVSGHPLAKYASRLQDLKTISLDLVEEQRNGKEITVASLIVGTRPMRSKKGARWAIFTIQDMTAVQEMLAFPESFARLEQVLKPGNRLLLKLREQVEQAVTPLSLGCDGGGMRAKERNKRAATLPDREKEIERLEKDVEELRHLAGDADGNAELERVRGQVAELRREFYTHLGPWQRAQIARHQQRPYTLDFINLLFTNFVELHGDRGYADDKAIIAGLGKFHGRPVAIIGHQKGRDTKQRLIRNFGQPKPEGYRKALRVMQLAAKFSRPIITVIDTPGAYPGIDAEERGQGEAIARNLREMARLPVPVIVTVTGEGGSGGALAIAVGDRVNILENSFYSVISPEGCASIIWRDATKAETAAAAMKITAKDLKELGIVDEIVEEPEGGAHTDFEAAARFLDEVLDRQLVALTNQPIRELLEARYEKFRKMGQFFDLGN